MVHITPIGGAKKTGHLADRRWPYQIITGAFCHFSESVIAVLVAISIKFRPIAKVLRGYSRYTIRAFFFTKEEFNRDF